MALGGTIRAKRATLRTPTESDLPGYARWMADLRVRRAGRIWHEPAMPATWKERLTEQTKEQRAVLWSIDADGQLAGLARVEVGSGVEAVPHARISHFIIDPDQWRRGIGWDTALALHRYLFDYLDLKRVGTELHADNVAAVRIAERLGYKEFARGHDAYYRDGGYADVTWILLERTAWDERYGESEREYASLAESR